MYSKFPSDGDESHRARGTRFCMLGAAFFIGFGASLMLLAPVSFQSEPTSLIGMPVSRSGAAQKLALGAPLSFSSIPGPSPWKELAIAGIEASNACYESRDVSMKAHTRLQNAIASMDSKNKAILTRATAAAASKAEDILKAGVVAPLGFFDPVGFCTDVPEGKILFYREVELKHGRICMLATAGIFLAEKFHPFYGGIDIPANTAFMQTDFFSFWIALGVAVSGIELNNKGPEHFMDYATMETKALAAGETGEAGPWKGGIGPGLMMRTDRIPGDYGFDPLGMKPKDPEKLKEIQNKEILNGRLAMIAFLGIIAQEIATGTKVFA